MTDEDKLLMEQYGITSEAKTIFHFEKHKYDRLADAVSYAKSIGKEGSTKKVEINE